MVKQTPRKTAESQTDLSVWADAQRLAEIKKIYGKNLEDAEFSILIQIGMATDLNPFLREIWAVKYGNAPASIFVGRDGYRKVAQRHPAYDYHIVDAVYSKDGFKVENGEVCHSYSLEDRGELVGAYCVVARKGSSRASFSYVELREYDTKKSVWASKPATMIKKVAEAQGLRMTFQELFAGTYDESEDWNTPKKPEATATTFKEVDPETGEVKKEKPVVIKCATRTQEKRFNELFLEYGELMGWAASKTSEMVQRTFKAKNVKSFEGLSEVTAANIIKVLEARIKDKKGEQETKKDGVVTAEDVAQVFWSTVEKN